MERYDFDITPAEYERIYNERKERQEREDAKYRAFLETPLGKFLSEEQENNRKCILDAILKGNKTVFLEDNLQLTIDF